MFARGSPEDSIKETITGGNGRLRGVGRLWDHLLRDIKRKWKFSEKGPKAVRRKPRDGRAEKKDNDRGGAHRHGGRIEM